jgi:hypothetical protein
LSVPQRQTGKKRVHDSDKLMAAITAKHILRHLDLAGDVIMKKPPALGGATIQGGAGFPDVSSEG